ncbi:conserved Plasmodium protein, unknown function [Plasmodium berghei]|uniref:Uncharacterized protein n=3 Tax=Plasmodium berghei TaxID=5821 RepID=A0A509AQ39_PLABA|nr:conserved Plasmodium protein, unknown function [Plasmodium berghei ANKA]CXJ12137.1 conserved Plasmodium protein, unknown function [Plasmodium berghei]SCO62454.1 conserved Plasmodium protein, unknown function [Plasmodium berghei]SCO64012.1 conserved Plasmodium protein, unknown function [Plasmodium berghei]VUC58145.1 conserved Plasmodium protein, unknown function [Plasmodium berghei ANKA]|eukprot:XP_034423908.1 conserved Plasmodium protein, unknown function [Plasmodium berghei ANKA]
MEEKITFLLENINFFELYNYIDTNQNEIDDIAKCIHHNHLFTMAKILEKCNNEKTNINLLNKNILNEFENEIIKKDNEQIGFYLRLYIYLLYKVLLFFNQIYYERSKNICEIFVNFSFKLLIFYDDQTFVISILKDLIKKIRIEGNDMSRNSNSEKECNQKYHFKKTVHSSFLELEKNILDLHFFVNLPNYIFLNCYLIYLYYNIPIENNHNLREERLSQIYYVLYKIVDIFECLDDQNNEYISSEQMLLFLSKQKENIHSQKYEKDWIEFVDENKNITLIYKKCSTPSILYKTIDIPFNTNIYSLEKNQYLQNYNSKNININNFLLLLKIMSPYFLLWISKKAEGQENVDQYFQKVFHINLQNELYKFDYYFVYDNFKSYNIINETISSLFFFFLLLESIFTSISNDKINNIKDQTNEHNLIKKLLNNYISFFKRRYNLPRQKMHKLVMHILKYEETDISEAKIEEVFLNTQQKKIGTNIVDTESLFPDYDILIKNTENIINKLKWLTTWAYISSDDAYELNFFHLSNSFIFNYNNDNDHKFTNLLNEYLYKKYNVFVYNSMLFKSTYEHKTLNYKYVDAFSNAISKVIVSIIYTIVIFCEPVQTTKDAKTKDTKLKDEETEPILNDNYSDWNLSYLNKFEKESEMKWIEENIIHFTKNIKFSEKYESFFNDILFICFKMINFPNENIQKTCISIIKIIVSKINIEKSPHIKYISKKIDALISFISEDEAAISEDNDNDTQNEAIKIYIFIKCKIKKEININLIESLENLINTLSLKKNNKILCSSICINILASFYYHPLLVPFLLHKYINIIFYLIESNNISIIIDALKCIYILFRINKEHMKIYNYDIVYRLYLLFNVFRKNNLTNSQSDQIKSAIPNNITIFLSNFFFNYTDIEKNRGEILLQIKLILHCIYASTPQDKYNTMISIFAHHPKEFKDHSEHFQIFSRFVQE